MRRYGKMGRFRRRRLLMGQALSLAAVFALSFFAARHIGPEVSVRQALGEVTTKNAAELLYPLPPTEPAELRQALLRSPVPWALKVTPNPTQTPKPTREPTLKPASKPTPKRTAKSPSQSLKSATSRSGKIAGYVIGKEYQFVTTGYCHCVKCNGKWAYGPLASGDMPAEGRTVAMGGVPLHTKVLINGEPYVVEDRGVSGNHIDIFYESHEQALRHGKKKAKVVILG